MPKEDDQIHLLCFSNENKKKVYLKGPSLVHFKRLLPKVLYL